jgi:uncharacterized protein (TIRG00374 family)
MSESHKGSWWRSLWRWLPGILISALALWLVLRTVTWKDVGKAWAAINPGTLVLVLVFYIIAMFARALCWRIILQGRVSWLRAFFVMNEGYLLNNVFPLRVGEIGRGVILGRSSGLGFFQVLSTIIVERAYDLAIAATLLLSTLPFVLAMAWARSMAWAILSLVVVGLVSLYMMARYREPLMKWAARKGNRFSFVERWLLPKVSAVLEGFAVLTKPGLFILSFAMMVLSWGLAILEEYLILRNLVPDAAFWWLAFVLGVSALGAAVPSVAGAIGVYEAAVVGALSLVGVEPATGLAFAIVIHVIQFGCSSLFGIIGLVQEGESLSSLYQGLAAKKSQIQ